VKEVGGKVDSNGGVWQRGEAIHTSIAYVVLLRMVFYADITR
jgi:hypothetical protein